MCRCVCLALLPLVDGGHQQLGTAAYSSSAGPALTSATACRFDGTSSPAESQPCFCRVDSPVERVVSVVKAAVKNRLRRRPKRSSGNGGYDGPVNLPDGLEVEGLAQAMAKTHSYAWLDSAVADTPENTPRPGGGAFHDPWAAACCTLAGLTCACSQMRCKHDLIC